MDFAPATRLMQDLANAIAVDALEVVLHGRAARLGFELGGGHAPSTPTISAYFIAARAEIIPVGEPAPTRNTSSAHSI